MMWQDRSRKINRIAFLRTKTDPYIFSLRISKISWGNFKVSVPKAHFTQPEFFCRKSGFRARKANWIDAVSANYFSATQIVELFHLGWLPEENSNPTLCVQFWISLSPCGAFLSRALLKEENCIVLMVVRSTEKGILLASIGSFVNARKWIDKKQDKHQVLLYPQIRVKKQRRFYVEL